MIVANNNNFCDMLFNQQYTYNYIALSTLIGSSSVTIINNGEHLNTKLMVK